MILGTLFYMLEEMNIDVPMIIDLSGNERKETYFEVIEVNIDEDKQKGTASIKDVGNNIISYWHWDKDLDIWIIKK